ncbi:MAG TPA: hypothetical protein VD973_28870, partial [Symbiobacteriaceae bacterium]|nr:hypothetical protein [Symbiobacteriaceae bacterium]
TEFGGARARVLTLWGSPFGDAPRGELVREVKATLARHYGHGAYQVVNELIRLRQAGQWDQLLELYLARVQQLATRFPGNVADRLSRYVALVWVAGDLVHQVLEIPGDPEAAVMSIMREVAGELEEGDYATRALDAVRAWAQANITQFYGKDDSLRPPSRYLGVWRDAEYDDPRFVALYPHELKKFLVDQGFSYDAVVRQWRDREWIKTQSGRSTFMVRVRDDTSRMIMIPLPIWRPPTATAET